MPVRTEPSNSALLTDAFSLLRCACGAAKRERWLAARMKYKHIASAIHNLGHSFASLMNYVDGEYVMDEVAKIHASGHDIEIDWLTGRFRPPEKLSPRIETSIGYRRADLARHLSSHGVDLKAITELKLYWPAGNRMCMVAVDDRGKEHKVYVD